MSRCGHHNMRIVWTQFNSHGDAYLRPQLRNYCDDCGELIGGALKHSLATADTPQLSQDEAMRALHTREEYWRERDAERRLQEEQWRQGYETYLLSPEWDDKRRRVLEREGGICEGCRKRPATQVHHETYQNVGNEPLFELRAVCRVCHQAIHGIEGDAS
jgi:5-methylcytosine-specific restriction endonuclease McrA